MVLACFSPTKVSPMIVCNMEIVTDRQAYIEILENSTVAFIRELLTPPEDSNTIEVATPSSYLFMHDNVPYHKAIKVTNYIKQ